MFLIPALISALQAQADTVYSGWDQPSPDLSPRTVSALALRAQADMVYSGWDQGWDHKHREKSIFMPREEPWEAYSNRTVRPSVPLRVRCISPIFFEVGIPNLVCGCILWWRSVAFHFPVAVTLTSDLVFIVITMSVCPASCPMHISYILWGRNSKFDVWMHLEIILE